MNEVIKINPEIQEVIKSSNISDLTKAEAYAINYAPLLNEVTAQCEILKTLEKGNKEHVEKAKRIRIDLGKIASRGEAQKKKDKEQILTEGRFIDALYNTVNGAARLTQNQAKEIEDYFEVQEQIRLEKLRTDRWDKIKIYTDLEPIGLSAMTDDVFNAFESGLKSQYEARIEAERKAEAERKQKEEAEKQHIEAQRVENERLKKEAEKKEKELAAERAKAEAEKKKQAEILAKQKADSEAKLKAEREAKERLQAELRAKAEAELKAIKDAEKKAADELKAKQLAESKAKKAPDKVKLKTWVNSIVETEAPTGMSNEALIISVEIADKFKAFQKWANDLIEKM